MNGGHHPRPSPVPDAAAGPRMPVTAWIIIGLAVLGLIAYLFVDHLPHLLAALPYLAIIGMAAMHVFGHGHRGGTSHPARSRLADTHGDAPAGDGAKDDTPDRS